MDDAKQSKNARVERFRAWSGRHWVALSIVGCLLVLAVVLYVLVPVLVLRAINNELESMPHFEGHAERLSLQPFRRGVVLHDLRLDARAIDRDVDLVRIEEVDVRVGWRGWWPKSWKVKVAVRGLKVDLLMSQLPDVMEAVKRSDFIGQFAEAPPLTVKRFTLEDSSMHLRFFGTEPPVQVYVTGLEGKVKDISNRAWLQGERRSTAKIKGMVLGRSVMRLEAEGNAFGKPYDCEGSFKLTELALAPFSPLMAEETELVEIVGGDVSTHTTAVCRDEYADVHVRMELRDVTFADPDAEDSLFERMGTALVTGALEHGVKLKGHVATTHFQTRVPYSNPQDVEKGRIAMEAFNNFSTEQLSEPLPDFNTESSSD